MVACCGASWLIRSWTVRPLTAIGTAGVHCIESGKFDEPANQPTEFGFPHDGAPEWGQVDAKYKTDNGGVLQSGIGGHALMKPDSQDDARRWRRRLMLVGCWLALLVIFWPRQMRQAIDPQKADGSAAPHPHVNQRERMESWFSRHAAQAGLSPEQIVAKKLSQFARSRREFAKELARKHNVQMPPEVERFFAAVESGNWDAIEAAFKKINGGNSSASQAERAPGVAQLWPAIIDAYGAAEQVHLWPAQQLLDYGNGILDALRPGMVYVGGTDNGRWIPELLNDTSDGEHHIVITQNGLAAGDYQEYLRLQYDDRMANLSDEESKSAFDAYVADAQKRLEHDQQFPNEPKQLLPGEDVRMVDGKAQVSGQVAVMAINERLLQSLMQKNPDLSFAIQESFPLRGTYADAAPLGPLMELSANNEQNTFTPDVASQSVDYWNKRAAQILSDPEASESALRSYSHDTVAAANLLAAHDFGAEAEQAYRLATQVWPGNPESANGLAELLSQNGRADEAERLVNDFEQKYPDQRATLERFRAGWKAVIGTAQPSP
jgi:hypothetical protein